MVAPPSGPASGGGPLVEDEDLRPGEVVGEYTVEHKLGEGAFGKVFKGRHPLIGKEVAIKVLARKFASDPEVVSRFVAEARAVNQISHRNIIDIFSFGQLRDGRQYFVMELLQGKPLDQILRSRDRLTLEEALPILKQLARALDAAHAKGVAHRDLKPANVFVAIDDEGGPFPKLLDFGVAKLINAEPAQSSHKTATGSPIGTPYYMSPEQCRAENVDVRTDIYSFGVMTYQLLTGTVPFSQGNYIEILFQHMTALPPPPSTRAPEVPPALDGVILSMMAKAPGDRPPTVTKAVKLLEEAGRSAGLVSGLASSGPHPQSVALSQELAQPVRTTSSLDPALGATLGNTLPGAGASRDLAHPMPKTKLPLVLAGVFVVLAGAGLVVAGRGPAPEAAPTASSAPLVVSPTPTPPPPPSPTEEPSPVSAPPPPPPPVKIKLGGAPAGAEVLGSDGAVLCRLPCELERPRGAAPLELMFQAKGYEAKKQSIVPETDVVIDVSLERRRGVEQKKKPRPQKDDIENAF